MASLRNMIDWVLRHATAIRLFLVSFTVLYLELALIRFLSAEVLYLGYFSNFVLMGVFLGLGLGFLLADRPADFLRHVPLALLILVAFVLVTRVDASYLREHIGQLFFGTDATPLRVPLWVGLVLILASTVFVFGGLGQAAARLFVAFPPIRAYSIDIAGSLVGIIVFTVHAYLGVPPVAWFALSFIIISVLLYRTASLSCAVTGLAVLLLVHASAPNHFTAWSPYQRIEAWSEKQSPELTVVFLTVNGIGHQTMQPVGSKEPMYDYPYTDVTALRQGKGFDEVLIIGAGSGSDVAYALRAGAKAIDAVEIDPVIYQCGYRFHPERPYSDPRVKVVIDDGRAYMERTHKRYDLVIYALPDSLAAYSNFANIRLESFLFTNESFRQAKELLKPDGVLVLYNYYRKEWLLKKICDMLEDVFGHPPRVLVYTDEEHGLMASLAIGPAIAGTRPGGPRYAPATDDWPFLYMRYPHIPPMYAGIMLLFVVLAIAGVAASGHATLNNMRINLPFSLMGAAFLLLETKSVIQFVLLFGATWLVNSLVFFAVLVSVLLANLLVVRLPRLNPSLLFGLLIGSLVAQYLLPLNLLLSIQALWVRYLAASVLLFSPIFFANLVFGFLFKDTPKAATAFGWNVIGTMIGGALEYTSMAVGYRTLTLAVIALYAACYALTGWSLRGSREPSRSPVAGNVHEA